MDPSAAWDDVPGCWRPRATTRRRGPLRVVRLQSFYYSSRPVFYGVDRDSSRPRCVLVCLNTKKPDLESIDLQRAQPCPIRNVRSQESRCSFFNLISYGAASFAACGVVWAELANLCRGKLRHCCRASPKAAARVRIGTAATTPGSVRALAAKERLQTLSAARLASQPDESSKTRSATLF